METITYREAVLEGISVPVGTPEPDILARAAEKMKRSGTDVRSLHFRLYKKSVDARHREDIRWSAPCCAVRQTTHPAFCRNSWRGWVPNPYAPGRLELGRGECPAARPR